MPPRAPVPEQEGEYLQLIIFNLLGREKTGAKYSSTAVK